MKNETDKIKSLSYQSASDELREIVFSIENGNIGIDNLPEKIERASILLSFCKNKLRDIEENAATAKL